jgi:O-antigen/teichoic acid export membrane protein
MSALAQALRRECRVAFSKRAQPAWFRVVKWIVIVAVTLALYPSVWFWVWLGGSTILALSLHCLYRWKTKIWTRPWRGWNDLEAGR